MEGFVMQPLAIITCLKSIYLINGLIMAMWNGFKHYYNNCLFKKQNLVKHHFFEINIIKYLFYIIKFFKSINNIVSKYIKFNFKYFNLRKKQYKSKYFYKVKGLIDVFQLL